MGTTFVPYSTRSSMIDDLTTTEQLRDDGLYRRAIKHCWRGNMYSGCLWVVFQVEYRRGDTVLVVDRFIECYAMRYHRDAHHGDGWAYKDMTEHCHPYYYSCPVGYLALVPLSVYGGNAYWRRSVIAAHNCTQEKRCRRREQRKRFISPPTARSSR